MTTYQILMITISCASFAVAVLSFFRKKRRRATQSSVDFPKRRLFKNGEILYFEVRNLHLLHGEMFYNDRSMITHILFIPAENQRITIKMRSSQTIWFKEAVRVSDSGWVKILRIRCKKDPENQDDRAFPVMILLQEEESADPRYVPFQETGRKMK